MTYARLLLMTLAVAPAAAAQPALPAWRAERQVIVTAGDPGVSLASPMTIAVSPGGVIAATQPADGWVRLFAADGKPIGTIGNLERTAGDVRRLTRIGFRAESLWIADGMLNRFTLFGPDSRLARTIPAPPILIEGSNTSGRSYGAQAEALLAGERMLVATRFSGVGEGAVPETRLHSVTAKTESLVAFPPLQTFMGEFRIDRGNSVSQLSNPLAAVDRFDVSGSGAFVAIVSEPRLETDSAEVRLFNAEGVERYRRRLSLARRPVTPALVDAEARELAKHLPKRPGDTFVKGYLGRMTMQANLPTVHRILVGDDGTVWLRLSHRHEDERWMILAPTGVPRATLTLPKRADRAVQQVSVDRLWAAEFTHEGLAQIVAYRIIPPG